jgi:predicted CoA-binding protein
VALELPPSVHCPSFHTWARVIIAAGLFFCSADAMTTTPSDAMLRDILTRSRSFACVGVSPDPIRPSHYVARYLAARGYRVVPVNPKAAGTTLFGQTVVASLGEVEGRVDVLDVFRRPEAVPEIVAEALEVLPGLSCVWLQIGVISPEAERMCESAGVQIVQDRCPKLEHQRLWGELRRAGVATGVISSRL